MATTIVQQAPAPAPPAANTDMMQMMMMNNMMQQQNEQVRSSGFLRACRFAGKQPARLRKVRTLTGARARHPVPRPRHGARARTQQRRRRRRARRGQRPGWRPADAHQASAELLHEVLLPAVRGLDARGAHAPRRLYPPFPRPSSRHLPCRTSFAHCLPLVSLQGMGGNFIMALVAWLCGVGWCFTMCCWVPDPYGKQPRVAVTDMER